MPGTLRIGRLRADCDVTGTPEAAAAVGERATRALRDHLPIALRSRFAAQLDGADESVWIVRRLEVGLAVASDAPADALASLAAASMGHALDRVLRDDGDGVNAIRFSSATAFMAQFVSDVAVRDPWSRWYYAPLAGWKLLPRSAAIRSALTQDPGRGRAVLRSLDDEMLASVTAALTSLDERAVLASLSRESGARGTLPPIEAVLPGCIQALSARMTAGRALFALVRSTGPATPATVPMIDSIFDAVDAARGWRHPAEGTDSIVAALRVRLPAVEPAQLFAAARSLIARLAGHEQSAASEDGESTRMLTRFGGLTLLLRDLDGLPWDAWTSGWPSMRATPAARVYRWLVLGMCSGRPHVADVLADSTWRVLAGIPRETTPEDVASWIADVGLARWRGLSRSLPTVALTRSGRAWLRSGQALASGCESTLARAAGAVLDQFARRLPGFASSTPEYLWRNVLAFDGDVEFAADRVVVTCGRPPLHLLLSLTGMTRGLAAGAAADGRPIVVFGRE